MRVLSDYFLASLFVLACLAGSRGLAAQSAPAVLPPKLTNSWIFEVRSPIDSSAAVGKSGTIYFGTFDGRLLALNPNGSRKWMFKAGREIKSSPAVDTDESIYFGSRDQKLYVLNGNGTVKWQFKTEGWVDSSPALSREGVYFGSWDKNFYALSKQGEKLWTFKTEGHIVSSPAIGLDGAIYFGSMDGRVYALNPAGEKKWEFVTSQPVISSPAINRGEGIYITSLDGFLYSLNLDGSLRWKLHTGGITESSPIIGLGDLVHLGVNKSVWSVKASGTREIYYGTQGVVENSPVAFADGSFAFVSQLGDLYCLTPKRELKCYADLKWQAHSSPAVGQNGALYMPTAERQKDFGEINANEALANSPWPKFRGNSRNTGNAADPLF